MISQNQSKHEIDWKPELADEVKSFEESQLYRDWYKAVGSGTPNDYVIAITAHPGYTLTSGTGKTTFGGSLAKNYFHVAGRLHDEPWDAQKHFTLDVAQFAFEILPNAAKGSCIVGDEMQGTAANSNLNSKRSQTNDALAAYGAIAGDRKNRTTKILIFQSLQRVNKDFFDFIDSWLLIVDDVRYHANHYKIVPEVFDLRSSKLKTPRVETLTWDPLPEDDDDYAYMEKLKDQANAGQQEYSVGANDDETDELPQGARDEIILLWAREGMSSTEISKRLENRFGETLSDRRIRQITSDQQ